MRYLLAVFILLSMTAATFAVTDVVGSFGTQQGLSGFTGRFPLVGRVGPGTPPPTGDILLVDGTSLILQTNGSSFICLAGGC